MHRSHPGLALAAALPLFCASALAQEPIANWSIPLHEEDGQIWAVGADFKARFSDGVEFFPLVGEEHPGNLPLRWQTRSLRRGEEIHAIDAAASSTYTATRFSLSRLGFEERYDIVAAGVEQSFYFETLPAGSGDLVIEGALTSELRANDREFGVAPIDFYAPNGTALVRYGTAIAIDAHGAQCAVETAVQAGVLSLRVPSSWLADAHLPLLVDPLLSRISISTSSNAPGGIDIAWDTENDHRLVAFSRRFAVNDWDLYSQVVTQGGSLVAAYFSEVDPTRSTENMSTAYVGGANRWVLAFERIDTAAQRSRIVLHIRSHGPVPAPGTTVALPSIATIQQRYPSLGGSRGFGNGDKALLVYQEDASVNLANTNNSRIWGLLIDAGAASLSAPFQIGYGSPQFDEEHPCVSKSSSSIDDAWCVVWQGLSDASVDDDWDIYGRLVRADSTLGSRDIAAGAHYPRHAFLPKVDGSDGRFLLYYGEVENTQRAHGAKFRYLRAVRLDWTFGLDVVTPHPRRTLRSHASAVFDFGTPSCRPIAYDRFTRSHWGLAWIESDRILTGARLGFDAGITESAQLYSVPFDLVPSTSVCFDDQQRSFDFAYPVQSQGGLHSIFTQDLLYGPALSTNYGSACAGDLTFICQGASQISTPLAGAEFCYLRMENGRVAAPTGVLIALGTAAIPLGNGCELLLDPASFFLYASGVSDALGTFQVQVPLASYPFSQYDLYWQFFQLSGAPLELSLSDGLRTLIQ